MKPQSEGHFALSGAPFQYKNTSLARNSLFKINIKSKVQRFL